MSSRREKIAGWAFGLAVYAAWAWWIVVSADWRGPVVQPW